MYTVIQHMLSLLIRKQFDLSSGSMCACLQIAKIVSIEKQRDKIYKNKNCSNSFVLYRIIVNVRIHSNPLSQCPRCSNFGHVFTLRILFNKSRVCYTIHVLILLK